MVYNFFQIENKGYLLIKLSNTQGMILYYNTGDYNEKAITETPQIIIEREPLILNSTKFPKIVDDIVFELIRAFGVTAL